ncbi:hypothetical protein MVEN_01102500 [Mycena venus]|uniref:Uncharacterized protein n=1 Tax=Mycena venus TaxID=2733690 RepID=A0A8H6Y4Q5_9AGAR|nr:hypothetical protein MVEN_01102500 [Mycena venus]
MSFLAVLSDNSPDHHGDNAYFVFILLAVASCLSTSPLIQLTSAMRSSFNFVAIACALLAHLGSITASPLESEPSLDKRTTCSNKGICSGPTGTVTCSQNLNPKTPWCICNCAASNNCFPLIQEGWCFSSGG